jgi:hypothetical protein
VCKPDVATATQRLLPETTVGAVLFPGVPFPSWPEPPEPQPYKVPSALSAKLLLLDGPANTFAHDVEVPIRTGVACGVVVPFPTSPEVLAPHAHSVPSLLIPSV